MDGSGTTASVPVGGRREFREGDLTDATALADALQDLEGAFIMQPTPLGCPPASLS